MTATAIPPRILYRATKNADGTLTVHDVPIFVECERTIGRGDERRVVEFGAEWIEQAVSAARAHAAEGYEPPLHVRHHAGDNKVVAAGSFRVTGSRTMTFGGEQRLAVFADLLITDAAIAQEVMQGRLPYRSVEIFSPDTPSIDSLALLDHEAPFLKFPMLRIQGGVPGGTYDGNPGPTVRASFEHGSAAALLFQMADENPKPKPDDEKPAPAVDASPAKDEGQPDQPEKTGEHDVDAIVKAIVDGSISLAGMQAIVSAIQQRSMAGPGGPGGEQSDKPAAAPAPTQMQAKNPMTDTKTDAKSDAKSDTKTDGNTPAPAKQPAASGVDPVQMASERAETAVQFAQMRAEIAGLNAKLKAQEDERQREADVNAAMKRLEGRPLGSIDALRAELMQLHAQSPLAFKAYVDRVEKVVGVLPNGDEVNFAANGGGNKKLPAEALKFQAQGPAAMEKAALFCAEWDQLHQRGRTTLTQARYVELSMQRELQNT